MRQKFDDENSNLNDGKFHFNRTYSLWKGFNCASLPFTLFMIDLLWHAFDAMCLMFAFVLQIYNFRRTTKNSKKLLAILRALRLHWAKVKLWQEVPSPFIICLGPMEKMKVNKRPKRWYNSALQPITINRNKEVEYASTLLSIVECPKHKLKLKYIFR